MGSRGGRGRLRGWLPNYGGLSYSTPECVAEGFDPARLTVRLVAHDDGTVAIEFANNGTYGVTSAELTREVARQLARLLEAVAAEHGESVGPRE